MRFLGVRYRQPIEEAEARQRPFHLLIPLGWMAAAFLFSACSPGSSPVPEAGSPTPFLVSQTLREQAIPTQTAAAPTQEILPAQGKALADCTYSAAFWVHYPDRWLTGNIVLGRLTLDQAKALELLQAEPEDERIRLTQQFIAVVLNTLSGADGSAVEEIVAQSAGWLDAHPGDTRLLPGERRQAAEYARQLEAFNLGETGPERCSDEPVLSTPTLTPLPTSTPQPTAPPRTARTVTATPKERSEEETKEPAATAAPSPASSLTPQQPTQAPSSTRTPAEPSATFPPPASPPEPTPTSPLSPPDFFPLPTLLPGLP